MAHSGGLAVVTGAQITHLTGLLGMALLSLVAPSLGLLAGLFMLVFYTGEPFGRIPTQETEGDQAWRVLIKRRFF